MIGGNNRLNVLLVLPKVGTILNFKNSFLEAFCKLNMNVTCYEVDGEKNFDIQRKEAMQCIQDNHITACLMINDISSNGIFFMNEELLKSVDCYVWFVDAAYCNRKDPHIPLYKGVYSFEPNDIAYGRKTYGIEFTYLPLTAGQSIFCNYSQKKEYIYDISFIGLVAGCAKRLELLDAVAKYCVKHHKKMICYGHFWHNAHPLQNAIESIKFKIKHPHLYRFVVNKRICAQDAANIYQHTRINLNIHIPKHSGFNCRTFEILGGHNFELCDIQNLEYIKLEDGEHIVFYKNKQDLLEKIAYYLNNDTKREKIANQGGAYVNEYYSFDKSLQKIFRCNK